MVICCVSGVPDIGKALDLIYTHLIGAADMEPADAATQAELREKLPTLNYPWPEHDGSPLPVGVYIPEGDIPALTIEADRVTLPLDDRRTCLFYPGRVVETDGVMSCCGMQGNELRMLARMLNAPLALDITVRFRDDEFELMLGGVGPEARTCRLKKQ